MKLLLLVALSFLVVACAAPKPGTAAHQRRLADEARENFLAMKEEERKSRPAPPPVTARVEPPARVRLKPFAPARPSLMESLFPPAKPVASTASVRPPQRVAPPKPAKPTPKPSQPISAFWSKKPRPADDTVYLDDVIRQRSEPNSKRYRAYKSQYAQALGKRPEELSKKELEWVRTHYQD